MDITGINFHGNGTARIVCSYLCFQVYKDYLGFGLCIMIYARIWTSGLLLTVEPYLVLLVFWCLLLAKGGYVFCHVGLFISLSICTQHYSKRHKQIAMKFYRKVWGSKMNVIKFWWSSGFSCLGKGDNNTIIVVGVMIEMLIEMLVMIQKF